MFPFNPEQISLLRYWFHHVRNGLLTLSTGIYLNPRSSRLPPPTFLLQKTLSPVLYLTHTPVLLLQKTFLPKTHRPPFTSHQGRGLFVEYFQLCNRALRERSRSNLSSPASKTVIVRRGSTTPRSGYINNRKHGGMRGWLGDVRLLH